MSNQEQEFKPYREESRKNWGTKGAGLNQEQVNTGAILRIADSLERIEKPYLNLLRDVRWLKEKNENLSAQVERMKRQNAGLKATITRMRKKQQAEKVSEQ